MIVKIPVESEDYNEPQPDCSDNCIEENDELCQLEASLEYSLNNITEEALGQLYGEYMIIVPELKSQLHIKYRDILKIAGQNYRIYITLSSDEELVISCLGYKYEDFLRILIKNRNELIIQDMLMYESKIFLEIEAEFYHASEANEELSSGECIVRLYETGLLIIPDNCDPLRIPYSLINEVKEENYNLAIWTDIGEKFILSKMGLALEGFKNTYGDLINKLNKKLQSAISEIFPEVDSSSLVKLSRLIKDGKSIMKGNLDSISEDLWVQMENKIKSLGLSEEYSYLKAIGQEDKISIGIKKGLMGSLTGEYIWFLIPVYSLPSDKPGNIIAMEAVSSEGEGRATYFFKIMDRVDYMNQQNIEELHKSVDKFIKLLNYCMLVINFRREPIYLSKAQLVKPQYIKYLYSIENQPALSLIRKHYIGRIIHSTPEQWKQDVNDILRFNSKEESDREVWKRNK